MRDPELIGDAMVAGAIAALASGAPSTLHAVATGVNPLEASLAAGTLLLRDEQRASRLLPAAIVAHGALSFGWAVVLAKTLPRRDWPPWSVLAGVGIAAFDLGVVGRRFPRIRALAPVPQVLDHVAYTVTVGWVLGRRRARR